VQFQFQSLVKLLAVSDPILFTLIVGIMIVMLGLIVIVRLLLRKEPTPARWKKFRVGVFVERETLTDEIESENDNGPPMGEDGPCRG